MKKRREKNQPSGRPLKAAKFIFEGNRPELSVFIYFLYSIKNPTDIRREEGKEEGESRHRATKKSENVVRRRMYRRNKFTFTKDEKKTNERIDR